MPIRKPEDRFAAIICDGAEGLQIDELNAVSKNGVAVLARGLRNSSFNGGSWTGKTAGGDLTGARGVKLNDLTIQQGLVEEINAPDRTRLKDELDRARIPFSDKEEIQRLINDTLSSRNKEALKEKYDALLQRMAAYATIIPFTAGVVERLAHLVK